MFFKPNLVSFLQIPSKNPIVGIHFIDQIPKTHVEFVDGNIGDHQITIKVSTEQKEIFCYFDFYQQA